MRKTYLQNLLCHQYGEAAYLTGRGLTWNKGYSFRPSPREISAQIDMDVNHKFDRDALLYGRGYNSLGQHKDADIEDAIEQDNCFLFGVIVKEPNTDEYSIPDQISYLKPILEIIASSYHTNIPHISTYACGIMYRSLRLGNEQIAQNWHVHKVLSEGTITNERAVQYEIPKQTMQSLSLINPNGVAHECLYSNRLGSHIQTKPSKTPLDIENTPTSYSLRRPLNRSLSKQLDDHEIAQGNSYVFHRAANVPQNIIGKKRGILVVSYLPTKSTERVLSMN